MDPRIMALVLASILIVVGIIGMYNYSVLREDLQEAYDEIERLRIEYSTLSQNITDLGQRLVELDQANMEALQSLRACLLENEDLNRQVTGLLEELNETLTLLEQEKERADTLQQELENLQNTVARINTSLARVNATLKALQPWYQPWGPSSASFLDSLLYWSSSSISDLAATVIEPWFNETRIAVRVLLHMAETLEYRPDPYMRVPDVNATIVLVDEMIQPANETLYLGGGGDEDLAVYAYSMIYAVKQDSIEMYLITVVERDTWTGLLIRAGNGGWLILDPANGYLTGIRIVMVVGDLELDPFKLSREAKNELLGGGASIVLQGQVTPKPLGDALEDWLNTIGFGDPARIYLDARGVHEEFDTIQELVAYLSGG